MEIRVMQDVLGKNDEIAAANQARFQQQGIFVLNLMGSPGSGKTTLLERTLELLKEDLRVAVIEGDLFTTKDADRIEKHGAPVVQINTAGGCHLDAPMIQKAMKELEGQAIDLLIIENVGNLVCPAEFELGSDKKAVVLSITEGDDKPLKYPLMFKEADVAVLNKADLLPYTDFDMQSAQHDLQTIHPGIEILQTSATKGEGLEAWVNWLRAQVQAKKEQRV